MYDDLSKLARAEATSFYDTTLQGLIEAQNQQKLLDQQAATQRYQNLLNTINQQKEPIQQQFQADTKSAYANKVLAGGELSDVLNRMNLNTSGFGVGQQMRQETAYGDVLGQLIGNKNTAMQNLDNAAITALGEYNATNYDLDALYASRLNDLNRYITEQTENKYNQIYSQLAAARQYEDALKLQKSSGGGSGYTGGGFASELPINQGGIPQGTNAFGNSDKTTSLSDYYFSASKGTQPRYVNDEKLSESEKKAGDYGLTNLTGVSKTQNVWKTASGQYYTWDNTNKVYHNVTDRVTAGNNNQILETRVTPTRYSSKAAENWYHANLGGKMSLQDLTRKIGVALNNKQITQADANMFLGAYGIKK